VRNSGSCAAVANRGNRKAIANFVRDIMWLL
jgi:hypothetical protein